MTPDAAAGPDTCPRCGGGFSCGMKGPGPCPCTTVALAPELLEALPAQFKGCLCLNCLQQLAGGAPLYPQPGRP